MSNDENVNIDDTDVEDKTEENDEDVDIDESDLPEDVKKHIKTLEAQRNHWKKKASEPKPEKAEKSLPTEKKEEVTDDFSSFVEHSKLIRGLSDDELEELENVSQDLGVSPAKAVQSKVWESHLGSYRSKREAEDTTPSPSHGGKVYKGKTFKEIATDPNASKADKQAAFEAMKK